LLEEVKKYELVFLDPDNGLEVKSVKMGGKNSEKYIYLCELEEIWKNNKSFLFFQHFPRINRDEFIVDLTLKISKLCFNSAVLTFRAANIVLVLALQPLHQKYKGEIILEIKEKWKDEFTIMDDKKNLF
ncbi:hypothetical protein, partial [Candidatus Igneacidithiobacillus taiwanensis]|uniref:hypothetical protein n=1 Tax=Candidatus Igneacidithiobacillus taiwanensis TaxID=1945924 RepID=UPI0028A1CB40